MRFFKYVSAETAVKILTTAHLRWSSPSLFNDPFDVQFDLQVDEFDEKRMAAQIIEELWSIYSGRKPFNAANELGRIFALFLSKRTGLSRADVFETKGLYDAIIECFGRMKASVPRLHEDQGLIFQRCQIVVPFGGAR